MLLRRWVAKFGIKTPDRHQESLKPVQLNKIASRRSQDAQDVGADPSGGKEREVVHGEGGGGPERPEPGEPAVRGAVERRPRRVPVPGGGHRCRGAAQRHQRLLLPRHHRQVSIFPAVLRPLHHCSRYKKLKQFHWQLPKWLSCGMMSNYLGHPLLLLFIFSIISHSLKYFWNIDF